MIKVKLLRPLDGVEAGNFVEYPENDAKRLADHGAVEIVTAAKLAKTPKAKK